VIFSLSCSVASRGNSDRLGRRHTACRGTTHFSLHTREDRAGRWGAWESKPTIDSQKIAGIEPHNFKSKALCPTNWAIPLNACMHVPIYYLKMGGGRSTAALWMDRTLVNSLYGILTQLHVHTILLTKSQASSHNAILCKLSELALCEMRQWPTKVWLQLRYDSLLSRRSTYYLDLLWIRYFACSCLW
jgi:hypothetical protein